MRTFFARLRARRRERRVDQLRGMAGTKRWMRLLPLILLAAVVWSGSHPSPASADWPYSTLQTSLYLWDSKVDGKCGAGADVVCIHYKDAGYPFGPGYSSSPNCWAVDYNGDGRLRYGDHSYIMFCRWGERFIYLADTRKCYALYRVNSHTPRQVAEVLDGRSCSGDWDQGPGND